MYNKSINKQMKKVQSTNLIASVWSLTGLLRRILNIFALISLPKFCSHLLGMISADKTQNFSKPRRGKMSYISAYHSLKSYCLLILSTSSIKIINILHDYCINFMLTLQLIILSMNFQSNWFTWKLNINWKSMINHTDYSKK